MSVRRIDRTGRLRRTALICCALVCAGVARVEHAVAADTCYRDDSGRIVTRRRPGTVEVPCPAPNAPGQQNGPPGNPQPLPTLPNTFTGGGPPQDAEAVARSALSRPDLKDYVQSIPVPDRWRIVDSLDPNAYGQNFFDPYHRNTLKADKPVFGDWFFNLNAFSDSVLELRDIPTAVGGATTARDDENDVFGQPRQTFFSQTLGTEFVLYEGDTVFKPPEYEFRLSPVFDFNRETVDELQEVNIDPRRGTSRNDDFVGLQSAFFDMHLRDVSDRYDFDSFRIGIQPFSTDFRGFLFQDNQPGVRFFGTRDDNTFQYNFAYFRRLTKDTNSGLNDLDRPPRHDDIFASNLYWQDMPVLGLTSQWTIVYDRDRERNHPYYDSNGFLERPAPLGAEIGRDYDVVYVGYNMDGHWNRWNLTTSIYLAGGRESTGTFIQQSDQVRAGFAALEVSRDFDWIRPRLSLLYASGDRNPFDRKATGFDAIEENPQFAGADSSFWIRQAVPLVGGGGVDLTPRDGVLNDLRSGNNSQSNFTNPGIWLAGLGVDFDILPTLRVSANANYLSMPDPQVVEVARAQTGLSHSIGEDVSASVIYRPLLSQNIVLRASYARLITGSGYDGLFPNSDLNYFLFNVLLAY
jgi:hypothetical protein